MIIFIESVLTEIKPFFSPTLKNRILSWKSDGLPMLYNFVDCSEMIQSSEFNSALTVSATQRTLALHQTVRNLLLPNNAILERTKHFKLATQAS